MFLILMCTWLINGSSITAPAGWQLLETIDSHQGARTTYKIARTFDLTKDQAALPPECAEAKVFVQVMFPKTELPEKEKTP